jgi:hypothetical protein
MPRARGTTDEYELAPQGVHPAVCADVVELGMQDTPWGPKEKIRLVWQIGELDSKGKRHTVVKLYTLSLHKKANLSLDLESWRGKKFTEDERKEGFEIENVLGANCLLNVQHNAATEGRTYANVVAIMPLTKGAEKLSISPDFVRRKDRDQQQTPSDAGSFEPPPDFEDEAIPFGG